MTASSQLENSNSIQPKKKKPLWKRVLKRTVLTLTVLIALVGIVIGILLYTVFTPDKITPIVLKFANEYLDAEVNCESVELTFFSTFPNLGVVLKNGTIIKQMNDIDSVQRKYAPQDSLLTFNRCTISLNPVAFLSERKIIVEKLELDAPGIYAYRSLDNRANWDILPPSDSVAMVADTAIFQMPELNIKDVRINNARVVYDDRMQGMFATVDSLNLSIEGNMSKDSALLDLALGIKASTIMYEGQALVKHLPLKIEAQLRNNRITHQLAIEQALLTAGVLAFNVTGTLQQDSIRKQVLVALDFGLRASSLSDLVQMIPKHILNFEDKIKANGEINLHGQLNGYLGQHSFPVLAATVQLNNGSLNSEKHSGLKKIEIGCKAQIDLNKQTSSYVHVENIYLQTESSTLKCAGKLDDVFTKPLLDMGIEMNINFNRLLQDLPLSNGMKIGGIIQMNLSGKCFLNDVLAGNYGKINATGNLDIDNMTFKYPEKDMDVFASSAKLRLGANTKDSIRGHLTENLLRGSLELDSLNLKYGKGLLADVNKFSAGFFTSPPKDSSTIAVMAAGIKIENFNVRLDSIQAKAGKTSAAIGLTPSANDKSKPEISAKITLENLQGHTPELGGRIKGAEFKIKLKQRVARSGSQNKKERMALNSDSIRQQHVSDLSFKTESEDAKKLMRELDISGTFECRSMGLRTPLLPLPIRMTQSSLGFTTNSLTLTQTKLKIGRSDMVLTGEVKGFRQALLRNGQVTAKVSIESDTVDVNQLLRAFAAGAEYAAKDEVQKDSISRMVLDDTKELTAESDTSSIGIFVVPRNIDLELNTWMKKVIYSNLSLNQVSGNVLIRNQSVQLSDMQISSEIGNVDLSLVYKAPDTKKANLGMDLQMHNIHIKEIINLFPMIDTLVPMLRSFEGVVDCNMAAMTKLDSKSNVILPETSASCYLKGENMVLMDGETFADISKMLFFKNKKRNLIDSISVEMIMENDKVMIFPFQVSIDRYSAAVGGTQNLDMSFNYHVSILKSPIPFKFGLNISGTPDKIKFRLAKAKYKDLFSPASEKTLGTVQINLRQQMEESLRKSINEIISQPLATPMRRPRAALTDSLQQEYFKLDTTKVDIPENVLPIDSRE